MGHKPGMSNTATEATTPAFSLAGPGEYFSLLKPRVMSLVVFTALVGMVAAVAGGATVNPMLAAVSLLAIAVGAGASGALNMWWDADIDALMARTIGRPIPRGLVDRSSAGAFGLVLSVFSVTLLWLASNIFAAGFLAFTIFFYVVIYSMWLKRSTPQNIVIGGAAGAVLGIMNSTGFAFQLSLLLTHAAEAYGTFVMLLLTALIAIILGMGMPTAAVYIVLVTVIAPTLVNLGVDPMAAHLFLFYFGLMSMITPPIAIGSIVAAQVANADMWTTSFLGVRLGVTAYLLPFLWIYNPAVLLHGTTLQIVLAVTTCVVAALLLRQSMLPPLSPRIPERFNAIILGFAAVFVGSSTALFGTDNIVVLIPTAIAVTFVFFDTSIRRTRQTNAQVQANALTS